MKKRIFKRNVTRKFFLQERTHPFVLLEITGNYRITC
jgi:hypothetical protein